VISLTPYGRATFQKQIERIPSTVHLYVEEGELKGYGYKTKVFDVTQWVNGDYPEMIWEFDAEDQAAFVLGYYVSDADGKVLFSDQFDESYKIQRQGDRIAVSISMNFIGAIGG